jgi:antitoxin component YwqK of YwqJK toxin-antitoxin module
MKPINTLLAILFISLLSFPSWSKAVGDLVERDGLYYEKFTDAPFNGKVTGEDQGSFKSGVKDGAWVKYHKNGQLKEKVNFKNGKMEGAGGGYHDNGQLWWKGNYKNSRFEGAWVTYYSNGQLEKKGNYKNSRKKEGAWVSYNADGTVDKEHTGIYKDDVKISD